jgi:hypothetical protein
LPGNGKLKCLAPITFTCTNSVLLDPTGLATPGSVIVSTSLSANCQNAPQCSTLAFRTSGPTTTDEDNQEEDKFEPTDYITLYPNPASTVITIKNVLPAKSSDIIIFNMQGRLMTKVATTNEYQNIDISSYAAGTYILKMTVNEEVIVKKFIKQ